MLEKRSYVSVFIQRKSRKHFISDSSSFQSGRRPIRFRFLVPPAPASLTFKLGPGEKPPVVTCSTEEVKDSCGNRCERHCGKPWPRPCLRICDLPACKCKEGYARHSNGKCVPADECPPTDSGNKQTFLLSLLSTTNIIFSYMYLYLT